MCRRLLSHSWCLWLHRRLWLLNWSLLLSLNLRLLSSDSRLLRLRLLSMLRLPLCQRHCGLSFGRVHHFLLLSIHWRWNSRYRYYRAWCVIRIVVRMTW